MLRIARRLAGLVFAITLGPGFALAQPSPFCGKVAPDDWPWVEKRLLGKWEMQHHAAVSAIASPQGTVTQTVAESIEPESATIEKRNGQLMATDPEMFAPLVLTVAGQGPWLADERLAAAQLAAGPTIPDSPDEAARRKGCAQTMLPRIIGTSQAVDDGRTVDFTYRLMVLDQGEIWGMMEARSAMGGVTMIARSVVTMRKR